MLLCCLLCFGASSGRLGSKPCFHGLSARLKAMSTHPALLLGEMINITSTGLPAQYTCKGALVPEQLCSFAFLPRRFDCGALISQMSQIAHRLACMPHAVSRVGA